MRLTKRKRTYWIMLLAVFTGMVLAATATQSAAQAQSLPTDLTLSYRHGLTGGRDGGWWIFPLTNVGATHVHSGQVQVSVKRHVGDTVVTPTYYRIVKPGSRFSSNDSSDYNLPTEHGHFDLETGIWHFRNLRPGQTVELGLSTIVGRGTVGDAYRSLAKGRGEIISSRPREGDMYLHNNVAEGWKVLQRIRHQAAEGDANLKMEVGDRFPAVNETVDFTVKFQNASPRQGAGFYDDADMFEVRVKVGISPGLELVSAAAPTGTTVGPGHDPLSVNTTFNRSTGIWDIGEVLDLESGHEPFIDMPVTVRYSGAVPLEEACLTAELVNIVPPERTDDPAFQRNNRALGCLGEEPTVLILGSGRSTPTTRDFKLIEFFPCVGATAYPCNEQDTLELVADIPANELGIIRDYDSRILNTGRGEIFQPNGIVIQVGDT